MTLSVPYYSQYSDVSDPNWQSKSCAITCLKMALDFEATNFNTTIPKLDELIQEGTDIKAFGEDGWIHRSIVFIAHNHGIPAYHEEFRSIYKELENNLSIIGHEKLIKRLEEGKTVIVSVEKGFNKGGSFHQIILIGHENGNFIYHEPEAKDELTGAFKQVSEEKFSAHWRHLAIFVG